MIIPQSIKMGQRASNVFYTAIQAERQIRDDTISSLRSQAADLTKQNNITSNENQVLRQKLDQTISAQVAENTKCK